MLEIRPALDYRSCALLKLSLYAFQERDRNQNIQALSQGKLVRRVPKLRMVFENLVNLFPEARVLAPQLVL
jgi:hypothetical protein